MTKKQASPFLETESCCCMVQNSAAYSFVMGKTSVISENCLTRFLSESRQPEINKKGADAISTFLFYVHVLEGGIRYDCSVNFRHNRSNTII